MPEEAVEGYIGGVGDAGEMIAHRLAGLHLVVAGLLDGHTQLCGLVIGGKLDDLIGILNLSFHLLATELIIFRSGHFRDIVPTQRQRPGSSNTACVRHNIADHGTGSGLRDLKHGTFQSSTCMLTGDRIVIRGVLAHLDLTSHSTVLPLDLRALAGFHIHSLTVGHGRMDFGRSGNEFWHTWWPRGPEELNSPVFKAELQEVMDTLRESVLKNRFAMERFCYKHGGKISGGWTQN